MQDPTHGTTASVKATAELDHPKQEVDEQSCEEDVDANV